MNTSEARRIPLQLIDASDRLRPVDEARAQAMAESMAVSGQIEAILVRPAGEGFKLVVGGHRYRGAQLLGWEDIKAEIEDMTALTARLKEIDENLYRHELCALDRAVFLSERKRVWEELNPETAHGANRDRSPGKSAKFVRVANLATRFTSEASEKLNISERTIRRACQLAASLSPEVIALVRQGGWEDRQADLEKLARLPSEQQLLAAGRIASGECTTFAAAMGRVPELNVDEKLFNAFTGLWQRSGAKVRRRILTYIGLPEKEIERIINPRAVNSDEDAA